MENKKVPIQVIRSNRKTIALEISQKGIVVLRIPFAMTDQEVRKFLRDKCPWIREHLKKAENRLQKVPEEERLSTKDLNNLAIQASEVIPKRVAYYAPKVGVTYNKITIRNQRSRWGSCSSKGNLNFNCLLMLVPDDVRDYVVVHELCHRKQMNHSKDFWSEVEKIIPDYKAKEKWLKENGSHLIRRMTG